MLLLEVGRSSPGAGSRGHTNHPTAGTRACCVTGATLHTRTMQASFVLPCMQRRTVDGTLSACPCSPSSQGYRVCICQLRRACGGDCRRKVHRQAEDLGTMISQHSRVPAGRPARRPLPSTRAAATTRDILVTHDLKPYRTDLSHWLAPTLQVAALLNANGTGIHHHHLAGQCRRSAFTSPQSSTGPGLAHPRAAAHRNLYRNLYRCTS